MTEPAPPDLRAGSAVREQPGDAATDLPPAVVATAGHVDHGKSSLVHRLTGMDPDRLDEEKRRGLTIELGFAWCTLPSGRELGFVDVPGHERFVRTMLAGVGPVRLVLFVVGADEGWKPQSEEHLAIVDVLGVDGAVVALTKRDLVDAHGLERARAEIRERLAGTDLEHAPVVACSSATGDGLPEIAVALDEMLASAPEPERQGRPRQYLDRVFSIKGAGTVVTGTLTGGPISTGDEVELLPSGIRARVRGLQTHRRRVEVARPVSRVAANLTGAERGRIERGEALVRAGQWRATATLEARVTPVRSLSRALTSRGAFKLHAGAAERDARVRFYDVRTVPSEGAFARITLSAPMVLDVGDRLILRDAGRRQTVAGGVVLDPDPPRRPGTAAAERLAARERTSRADLPSLVVRERRAVPERDLDLVRGTTSDAVAGATRTGGWWVADDLLEDVSERVRERLAAFHAADPVAAGEDVASLRAWIVGALGGARAPRDGSLADAVLDRLVADGLLAREGAAVRLASHRSEVAERHAELVAAVRDGEPTPPTVADLEAAGFSRGSIEAAIRSGDLVRISPELVLTPAFVGRAAEAVRASGEAGITVSALRERIGTSRKYAVPLLEHFDRTGVTRRTGDLRFARASRSHGG
jgi:selenocysteine-specific elongation factor